MYVFIHFTHIHPHVYEKPEREIFFHFLSLLAPLSFPQKIELIANNFFFFLLFNFCFFFFHTSYIIHTPRYVFNTHFLLLSENLCRNKNKFALSLFSRETTTAFFRSSIVKNENETEKGTERRRRIWKTWSNTEIFTHKYMRTCRIMPNIKSSLLGLFLWCCRSNDLCWRR